MSLILDALRKLEREKHDQEPGVLVVGSVPWGESSRGRRLMIGAGAALALALAVFAGWLLRRTPAAPPAAAHPASVPATPPASSRPSVVPATLPASLPPAARAAPEPSAAPPIRLSHPPVLERPGRAPDPAATPTPLATDSPESVPSAVPAVEPRPEVAVPPAPAPATPAATPPATAGDELRLSAISQRDGKPVALINDRLVFEGDSFDGVLVIRIGESEVEVEVKGQRRILRF